MPMQNDYQVVALPFCKWMITLHDRPIVDVNGQVLIFYREKDAYEKLISLKTEQERQLSNLMKWPPANLVYDPNKMTSVSDLNKTI